MILALLLAASSETVLHCQIRPASIGAAVDGFARSSEEEIGLDGQEQASLVIRVRRDTSSERLSDIRVELSGRDYLGIGKKDASWHGHANESGLTLSAESSSGQRPRRWIRLDRTSPTAFSAEWLYEFQYGSNGRSFDTVVDGWSGIGTCSTQVR